VAVIALAVVWVCARMAFASHGFDVCAIAVAVVLLLYFQYQFVQFVTASRYQTVLTSDSVPFAYKLFGLMQQR
jgi:hypothetical protein